MDPIVVAGSGNPKLAAAVANALDTPLAETDIRRFPDGEVYARIITPVRGRDVVIVQGTWPNDHLVELMLLQDAARHHGAAKVTSVIPYYGYARQDRVFKEGEAVSSRAVARALTASADRVVTVDPHKSEILSFFDGTGSEVSAVEILAGVLGDWGTDVVLAPDAGARDRAERAAAVLGVPHDHLEKKRLGPSEVEMRPKNLDVKGRSVAIVDDMIASGGTMVTAAAQLKEQGAAHVYAACTHGVFTDGAVERLLAGGIDRVLCTDTIEAEGCDSVSVAPAVVAHLRA